MFGAAVVSSSKGPLFHGRDSFALLSLNASSAETRELDCVHFAIWLDSIRLVLSVHSDHSVANEFYGASAREFRTRQACTVCAHCFTSTQTAVGTQQLPSMQVQEKHSV